MPGEQSVYQQGREASKREKGMWLSWEGWDHVGEAPSETDPRAHLQRSQEWASLESLLRGPHQPGHFPASLPFPQRHQQDLPQKQTNNNNNKKQA